MSYEDELRESLLVEVLAELEHEQWMEWSKAVCIDEDISEGRRCRWMSYWVPYEDLDDNVKEQDRVYARKIINKLKDVGVI